MKNFLLFFLFLILVPLELSAQITVSGSSGANGNYTSLTAVNTGAFARINSTPQTQNNIVITITGNSLNESGITSLDEGLWNSLIIYPTVSGLSISGNAGALIELNGADRVTIDGRVNASGSTPDLIIVNTNSNTCSTIRLMNSSENNIIRYCNIQGVGSSASRGTIWFSSTTSGNGNDGNLVEYNNITTVGADRSRNAILSSGSPGFENSSNTIQNNNIYNFLDPAAASQGIYISLGSTAWTISGNSFYETAPLIPTNSVAYYLIRVNSTSGTDYVISGNYLGGRSPMCGGLAFTKSIEFNNLFTGIFVNASTSSIQNNTIKNFNWSNSLNGTWTGIQTGLTANTLDVNANISGNTIGDITGTGSITVTCSTNNSNFYGINIAGQGAVDCQNNNIGSITTANASTNASNIFGINKTAETGVVTINNNIIGSTVTANSINASSQSTMYSQNVRGIYNLGTGTITMNGNTIGNLTDGSTNPLTGTMAEVNGIASTNGINIISGNKIFNLKNSNGYSVTNQNSSVCGISLAGATKKTVSGNEIYNLSNTFPAFTGSVMGIYFTGGLENNIISENFIHDLSITSGSNLADIYGIRVVSGASTYSNNIITLGGSSNAIFYGIYETGAAGNDNKLYFNTVYIGGTPSAGSNNSYALYSAVTTNSRDFRNNVLVNGRSSGGSNYSIYFVNNAGTLICDYNDYFVSGTGGILGRFGTNKTILPIVTGQDVNSFAINPAFSIPGGSAAANYNIGMDLIGVNGTNITTDYGSAIRNNPTMGAWERVVNKWKGSIGTDWNTLGNWTGLALPLGPTINLIFDDAPLNHCYLDADKILNNITSNQSAYNLSTNGHKLTVKGTLYLTGGAKIDAASTNSIVEFAGTLPQEIPSGAFFNNQVYNLLLNNANNVTLSGTMNILNTITSVAGNIDASTNSPTVVYGGGAAQSLESNIFTNNTVYNLRSENATGLSLGTDFTITNRLTINAGKLTIPPSRTLTVFEIVNNSGNSGILIKSDATGDGRLINNTPSVPATVELYLTGGLVTQGVGRFHYIVPPVESMYIGTTIAEVKTSLGLSYFNGDLLRFREPQAVANKDAGWQYFDNWPGTPPGFTSIVSTNGYNIYLNGGYDVIKFKGNLNAPTHTFPLSYTTGNAGAGWNLVGNPFPCNYDLNGVAGLGTIVAGISNTVYYNNDGGYGYWNVYTNSGSSGSYSDILPPMTGFYVKTSVNSLSLVFPTTSKVLASGDTRTSHKGGGDPESKGIPEIKKVKLKLTSVSGSDETIVLLIDDATNTYNEHYDAYKLFGKNAALPNIYSTVLSTNYFMKALKGPATADSVIIPLKVVIREQGTHEISVPEFENLSGLTVTLKHGAKRKVLSKDAAYSFTSAAGTFSDFELIIGTPANIQTVVPDFARGKFDSWYRNNYLYINCPDDMISGTGSVVITDMMGRRVYSNEKVYFVPGQTIEYPVSLPKGIYILSFTAHKMPFVSKFVVF